MRLNWGDSAGRKGVPCSKGGEGLRRNNILTRSRTKMTLPRPAGRKERQHKVRKTAGKLESRKSEAGGRG